LRSFDGEKPGGSPSRESLKETQNFSQKYIIRRRVELPSKGLDLDDDDDDDGLGK